MDSEYVIRIILEAHNRASKEIQELQAEIAKLRGSSHGVSDLTRGVDEIGTSFRGATSETKKYQTELEKTRLQSNKFYQDVKKSAEQDAQERSRLEQKASDYAIKETARVEAARLAHAVDRNRQLEKLTA